MRAQPAGRPTSPAAGSIHPSSSSFLVSRANYSEPVPADRRTGADRGAEMLVLTVPAGLAGQRFDQALAELVPQHSRSRLKDWIDAGHVTLDRAPAAGARPRR